MVRYKTPERRMTKKRGFKTKRDADAFAATVEHSKLVGGFVSHTAGRATVAQIADEWRAGLSHLKPKTIENLESAYAKHVQPEWATWPVGEISAPRVRSWITTRSNDGVGVATLERALGVLRQILDVAVEQGNLAMNPAAGIKPPRRQARDRVFLDHDQVRTLAEAADDDATTTLIYVLAYCGLRFGEAAALRVRDVNLARRRLHIVRAVVEVRGEMIIGTTKTGGTRTVPLPSFLADRVEQQMRSKLPDALLFGAGASPVRLNNWRRREYARAIAAAREQQPGFPAPRVHDLRHTAASLAIGAGANVKAVQTMLGHASAAMTLDRYGHLFEDDLDLVAAALERARSLR